MAGLSCLLSQSHMCLHQYQHVLFCFVLFALQLSVCLWWHDYRRDDFPTLKFGVVMADLARHLLREEPFALSAAPAIRAGEPGRC